MHPALDRGVRGRRVPSMKQILLALLVGMLLSGCGDDNASKREVKELRKRLQALESDEKQATPDLEAHVADAETATSETIEKKDPSAPSSVPVEDRNARPGSMVDQIVGRSDTTMRNSGVTTSIDIDMLHRIAQDWWKNIKMHDLDHEEVIQIEATNEGLKVTLYHGDEFPIFKDHSPELTDYGNSVMERMAWLLDRHVLTFTVDAHTSHDFKGTGIADPDPPRKLTAAEKAKRSEAAFQISLFQANQILRTLSYYSNGDLASKAESINGHGFTKPNTRYPNRIEKNRRVELSLKLDVSKVKLSEPEP